MYSPNEMRPVMCWRTAFASDCIRERVLRPREWARANARIDALSLST